MFDVLGAITNVETAYKTEGKGKNATPVIDPETGEHIVKSYRIIIGGWRNGFTCIADADKGPILPKVGQMVEMTVTRESWESGKRADGSKEYSSIYKYGRHRLLQ